MRANALAVSTGVSVDLVGFPPEYPCQGKSPRFRYISYYQTRTSRQRSRVDKWRRRLGPLWTFLAEPFLVKREAYRLYDREGYDLVWVHHGEPWLLLVLAVWRRITLRRPIPTTIMITGTYYTPESMRGRPLKTKVRGWLNQESIRWLPYLVDPVFDTVHLPRYMKIEGRKRVHVIPEGHEDLRRFATREAARVELGLPRDGKILLLFGVASAAKGADLLLRALKDLPRTFTLCLVGQTGGVYKPEWVSAEELEASGWKDRIHINGRHVWGREMDLYFIAADAVVFPYRHGFLAVSSNLRQASEHGRPVIACDQYHFGDFVRRYDLGLLFPPEDVPALRRCLEEFASLPARWFEEKARCSERVLTELSWERVGEMYMRLARDILGRG